MASSRIFLYLALGLMIFMLWQQWQLDYGVRPTTEQGLSSGSRGSGLQSPRAGDTGELSSTAPPAPVAPGDGEEAPAIADIRGGLDAPEEQRVQPPSISVVTDVFDAEVSLEGGGLRRLLLLQYPRAASTPDDLFALVSPDKDDFLELQSGLQTSSGEAPGHQGARYRAGASSYRLADGADELRVPLHWISADGGLEVRKTLVFRRGSYVIETLYNIENRGQETLSVRRYSQFLRGRDLTDKEWWRGAPSYSGGVLSTPLDSYRKFSFDDFVDEQIEEHALGGWAAWLRHYFTVALIPPSDGSGTYYSRYLGDRGRYLLGHYSDSERLAPAASVVLRERVYLGPKQQERMAQVAPNLELTIDYGWLYFLSEGLFWVMDKIHGLVGNWGWSIILLTLLVKLLFYKLSETSYKSMARMRRLTPRLKELRERYGDDRQRIGQETMQLYKREKVNPLSGCWPVLIQIPVFIALYWVLVESVELRQAPFALWIRDLSIPDPYFVLPVLMAITMFVQYRLNPKPPDPMQARIFLAMPIMFSIFSALFPSGLVLYWTVNNLLSVAQQFYITRYVIGETYQAETKPEGREQQRNVKRLQQQQERQAAGQNGQDENGPAQPRPQGQGAGKKKAPPGGKNKTLPSGKKAARRKKGGRVRQGA